MPKQYKEQGPEYYSFIELVSGIKLFGESWVHHTNKTQDGRNFCKGHCEKNALLIFFAVMMT